MLRRISIAIAILLSASALWADGDRSPTTLYVDYGTDLAIAPDSLVFENRIGLIGIPDRVEVAPYRIIEVSRVPFVVDSAGSRRFLLLEGDGIAMLYLPSNIVSPLAGVEASQYRGEETLVSPWSVIASSYLQEGQIAYAAENLSRIRLDAPWSEGVDGNGIGEWIEFDLGPFSRVFVLNGFISYDRPYLYERNSRLRTVEVRDMTDGDSWIVTLGDSPNPQAIDLEDRMDHRIRLTILDVYEGTHYDDTCVAGLLLCIF